ncbi:MAG: HD domain-containing protein [Betaproteobacteria bacterium]|nr:HD domain-containing protein [Betaproteobacteria bacterium]
MRKTTIITDPIHQVMNLGSDPRLQSCLKSVMDTREFQRLRRITQLGLTSYVFPGATHTRFSHSLGVAYLAREVLAHLLEREEDLRVEIEDVLLEVVLAALLHDVGHGPFSHSFEHVLGNVEWIPKHEDWTGTLITNRASGIQKVLTEARIDPEKVASAVTKSTSSSLARPYRQIVSSQIDVDRMDYLLRDSHFAGVTVGHFDAQYLINSMVIINHDSDKSTRTLGLTPKGIKAYEAFLLARQLMNRTVYFHHNVKVLEFMLESILRIAIDGLQEFAADSTVSPTLPPYLKRVREARDGGCTSKQQFMDQAMSDYVNLTEDAVWVLVAAIANSSADRSAQILAQRLLRRSILLHFQVAHDKEDLLDQALRRAGFRDPIDYHLLDLTTTMYKGSGDEGVFVRDWGGNIEEVTGLSGTITAFRDRPEVESLLIVVDGSKAEQIRALGIDGQFILPPPASIAKETPVVSPQ